MVFLFIVALHLKRINKSLIHKMAGSIFLFLNLGGGEIFIVVLVIILLFGSDQLPQLVKSVGKGIREINDAKNQIQSEIQNGVGSTVEELNKNTTELKNEITEVQQTIKRQVNNYTKTITEEVKAVDTTTTNKEDK